MATHLADRAGAPQMRSGPDEAGWDIEGQRAQAVQVEVERGASRGPQRVVPIDRAMLPVWREPGLAADPW